jgi:hypothetical protein
MLRKPDPSLVREWASIGIDHCILSSPWRPDVAHFDPADKVKAFKDLAEKVRRISA